MNQTGRLKRLVGGALWQGVLARVFEAHHTPVDTTRSFPSCRHSMPDVCSLVCRSFSGPCHSIVAFDGLKEERIRLKCPYRAV